MACWSKAIASSRYFQPAMLKEALRLAQGLEPSDSNLMLGNNPKAGFHHLSRVQKPLHKFGQSDFKRSTGIVA